MKLGIIGAMREEIDLLVSVMEDVETTSCARMDFHAGLLRGAETVVAFCGMGKVNTAVCAQVLIDRFDVEGLIFTGVAGALAPNLGIGDLVVSTDCVHADMDATGLGWEIGVNPDIDMLAFPADEHFREVALRAIAQVAPEANAIEGRIGTGDQFIDDAASKERIVSTFGAVCCEMEGAAVAQTAWLNNLPYVVIRAISDNADEGGGVDFRTFLESSSRIAEGIVEHMVQELSA